MKGIPKIQENYVLEKCIHYETGVGMPISARTSCMWMRRVAMSPASRFPMFPIRKQEASVTFPG